MTFWHDFHGPNAGYVLELYERYRQDPDAVDPSMRAFFEQWTPPADGQAPAGTAIAPAVDAEKVRCAVNLAQAIREFGHLAAQLDPLGSDPPGDPALHLDYYNLSEDDLRRLPAGIITGPLVEESANAWDAIRKLQVVYTRRIGYDYEHIRAPKEREWLQHAAESGRFRPPQAPIDLTQLLDRLTQVEVFEHFLHRFFPGKTRFSIEGLDMMVPMLDDIVWAADADEVRDTFIGMAHRGRLNVLAHVLNMPTPEILAMFKDPGINYHIRDELGWTGDVKYHAGTDRTVTEGQGEDMRLTMPANPSHLEHVNPVLVGMARAAGSFSEAPGRVTFNPATVLPILIHGDASFTGQGIVAETLNMSRLPGYEVGGTIHIIANNQLGYTTLPRQGRSTLYASDLAKGYKIPIVHVNADDPEACIEAARLAFAYRTTFKKDFVIDLIGYRRYGHNEGDEPSFTQPRMYATIDDHPSVRAQLAGQLEEAGEIASGHADGLVQHRMVMLQETLDELVPEKDIPEPQLEPPPPGAAKRVESAIPATTLRELNEALLTVPDDFTIHPKVERGVKRRRGALDEMDKATIDWATAEDLALGSILADGTAIRMTGEDAERGTFSQRHAVWHDYETGAPYVPLQSIPQAQAAFELHNSPLTENAAVGFEYGYDISKPLQLVIWEAQYGDFINGAQAMVDEFVVSGRAKWEQTPGLVLLLPHGYEGQGPDHSTGRVERFLQLGAEINIRVANPSTAAQYFHLLRRQALLLETDPLPLIVMTPKSLLRHPKAASTLRDLAESGWQRIIDDPDADPEQVRRLILCSGKVYVDLIGSDRREETPEVAIARLEQLYPYPHEDVPKVLDRYPSLDEVVWLQEEPQNMGAWEAVRPSLEEMIDGRWPLRYVGRPRRASPAEGSRTWHQVTQDALVKRAFEEK